MKGTVEKVFLMIQKFYKPQTAVVKAMKKGILPVFAVLSALVLLALATAATADSDNSNDAENLRSYSDRAFCNIDFYSKVLSDTATKVPQASALKIWADKLASDASQLKSLAGANDSDAFHKFVRETLNDDLKAADDAVRSERKNYSAYNVTKNITEELKENYKAGKKAFEQCKEQKNIKVAMQKVNNYLHILSQRQVQITKLEKRNINTAELSAIITEAQDTIIKPIQDAINSGNVTWTAAALKQYCLEDGCRNGTNFHFSARFEQARLAALLDLESAKARREGWKNDSKEAETELEHAKAALRPLGSSQFATTNKSNMVWNLTKQAVETLKKLRDDTNAARKIEKKLEERKQAQRLKAEEK